MLHAKLTAGCISSRHGGIFPCGAALPVKLSCLLGTYTIRPLSPPRARAPLQTLCIMQRRAANFAYRSPAQEQSSTHLLLKVRDWELLIGHSRQPTGTRLLPIEPDGAGERRTRHSKGVRNEGVCWPASRLFYLSSPLSREGYTVHRRRPAVSLLGCRTWECLLCVGFVQTVYADMCTYVAHFQHTTAERDRVW